MIGTQEAIQRALKIIQVFIEKYSASGEEFIDVVVSGPLGIRVIELKVPGNILRSDNGILLESISVSICLQPLEGIQDKTGERTLQIIGLPPACLKVKQLIDNLISKGPIKNLNSNLFHSLGIQNNSTQISDTRVSAPPQNSLGIQDNSTQISDTRVSAPPNVVLSSAEDNVNLLQDPNNVAIHYLEYCISLLTDIKNRAACTAEGQPIFSAEAIIIIKQLFDDITQSTDSEISLENLGEGQDMISYLL